MKRRAFIQSSLATVCSVAASAAPALSAEAKDKDSTVYELRVYSLKAAKLPLLDAYLSKAYLPAIKRLNLGPVGVFEEKGEQETLKIYVLTVCPSADWVTFYLPSKLAADEAYLKAASDYLAAPASDPVYTRIESSVLAPIQGMSRLEKPDASKPRLLNLRVYESHNERAGKKKIEMFNKSEIAIFRRVGLTPVFFAETVVGAAMPNLTYLLVFPDDAARKAAWSRFGDDAEWKKLKSMPEYADKEIVSRITNKLLTPLSYSEI